MALPSRFLSSGEDGVVGQTAKERLVGSWTLVSLTAGEGAHQTCLTVPIRKAP